MILKLPTHVQQKWLNVAYMIIRGGLEPLFADITEFVKEQADLANTRYGLLFNRGRNSCIRDTGGLNGKIGSDYDAAKILYVSTSDDDVSLRSSSCMEGSKIIL
ncbi:unnamed protein product [Schistosoma margrebowiei]|uniref:Uncharacterized protein n=1 Tax=Schistosoma margrebowiei TaxID=48269 RepID=A0A183M0A6_9TREM|nr:unnamed protein product [Schistosoma margrebowiei]